MSNFTANIQLPQISEYYANIDLIYKFGHQIRDFFLRNITYNVSFIRQLDFKNLSSSFDAFYSRSFQACSFIKTNIEFYSQIFSDCLKAVITKIQSTVSYFFQNFSGYIGYIVGPMISLLGAFVIRLAFSKRVPSQGPLLITLFGATTILITVWAVQFFKHPRYQKIINNKGVREALVQALPLPKPQIIEPMHSRGFLTSEKLDLIMIKPDIFYQSKPELGSLRQSIASFKQNCVWVNTKIKLARAKAETVETLRTMLVPQLTQLIVKLVLVADKALINEFIAFTKADPVIKGLFSKEEIIFFYEEFGSRLVQLLKNEELVSFFPEYKIKDVNRSIMDALITSNPDRLIDVTISQGVDSKKVLNFSFVEDPLLSLLNYKISPMNLVQASILMGDVESLKRIIASSTEPVDWAQKDSCGLSLQTCAALSSSKAMWEFIKEFIKTIPPIEHQDFLHLLYASIKGDNLCCFEELMTHLQDEALKDLVAALILELYEKAVIYGASEIKAYLEKTSVVNEQLALKTSIYPMLKAAIQGSDKGLFGRYFIAWTADKGENAFQIKELYEALLKAKKPEQEIFDQLNGYESTLSASYKACNLDLSNSQLSQALDSLNSDSMIYIVQRIAKPNLLRYINEFGTLFNKLIKAPKILAPILDKCTEDKYLLVACAKAAIRFLQPETLRMLCAKGVNTLKKLPDSNDSLLTYALLSYDPVVIEVILSSCGPLSSALLAELKVRLTELKCHREDESVYQTVLRMFEAKSLEKGDMAQEDGQLHLALIKSGAMEFTKDSSSSPKEESSRGLISSGLGFLGIF